MIWDVKLVPKRKQIPVTQLMTNGEVGLDMWLIPVWTDAMREQLASDLWGGRPF